MIELPDHCWVAQFSDCTEDCRESVITKIVCDDGGTESRFGDYGSCHTQSGCGQGQKDDFRPYGCLNRVVPAELKVKGEFILLWLDFAR